MIGPIQSISAPVLAEPVSAATPTRGSAFQEVLTAAIRSVDTSGKSAAGAVEQFLSGEGEELHNTILATQRAQLAFELFLQARNKVVSAYQEIMRMQM